MTFKMRTMVLGIIVLIGLCAYAIGRYYSTDLVYYSVERSLMQKAVEYPNSIDLRDELRVHLESLPSDQARLERLLSISRQLEKIQKIDRPALERLLKP